jgi:hypothetical protein
MESNEASYKTRSTFKPPDILNPWSERNCCTSEVLCNPTRDAIAPHIVQFEHDFAVSPMHFNDNLTPSLDTRPSDRNRTDRNRITGVSCPFCTGFRQWCSGVRIGTHLSDKSSDSKWPKAGRCFVAIALQLDFGYAIRKVQGKQVMGYVICWSVLLM